jgi:hypothetical protein
VSATQYGAGAIILIASALTLIPRDVRHTRSEQAVKTEVRDAEPVRLAPVTAEHIEPAEELAAAS